MASACHFADFVSLAMVSRRVRIATLASIHVQVLERTTSCSSSPHPPPRVTSSSSSTSPIIRKACWSCGAQICPGCALDHHLSHATAFHSINCRPSCSRCFRRLYCGKHALKVSDGSGKLPANTGFRDQWQPQRCFGHGSRPRVVAGEIFSPGHDYWNNPGVTKEICRTCSYFTVDEREAQRTRREITVCAPRTVEGDTVPELRCMTCLKNIRVEEGQGVWWSCKICSLECAEDFHG